jgi:hypothetical protein
MDENTVAVKEIADHIEQITETLAQLTLHDTSSLSSVSSDPVTHIRTFTKYGYLPSPCLRQH